MQLISFAYLSEFILIPYDIEKPSQTFPRGRLTFEDSVWLGGDHFPWKLVVPFSFVRLVNDVK